MDTPITPPVPAVAAPPAAPVAPATKGKPKKPARSFAKRMKDQADASRKVRDELVNNEWKKNVQYRLGKPYTTEDTTTDRVAVPVDWTLTKAKEAGLFSQVPSVNLTAKQDKYKAVVPVVQVELNTVLREQVKADVLMEESLADLINASGLAGVITGIVATYRDVPSSPVDSSMMNPDELLLAQQNGALEPVMVKQRVDCKLFGTRLSPSQLLWPKRFKGSDFDDADWVGYDGACTWAEALREFGADADRPAGLTPEMKEKVCGGAEAETTLSEDDSPAAPRADDEMVSYTRIYYWKARQDPDELYLEKIGTFVYIKGIDDPVIDEDFKGQEWDEATKSFVGLTKFPLRIAKLTYISDTAVSPSDSEMGRPQVDEKMRSRSQMVLQRDRSAPMRWGNVNRIDPTILASLQNGDDYQRIVPVNGDGSTALGEVARANYPQENWEFDRVTDKDLADSWQVGPNQTGQFNQGGRTAAEANIVQGNFATRQAKERAKVAKFFCGIAEAVLGWMQIGYDGTDTAKEEALLGNDAQRLQGWDRKTVSGAKFVYNVREDSTVKLDSAQQTELVTKFLNIAGKSGFANVQFLVGELASLSGLDPAKATTQPEPKAPEPPNVSLRAGGEDLRDPIVGPYLIALMQKGHPVEAADVEAAKQLLIASSSGPTPPPAPPQPGAPPMPPGPGAPPPPAPPAPQPPKDYGPMERVTKRTEAGDFGG